MASQNDAKQFVSVVGNWFNTNYFVWSAFYKGNLAQSDAMVDIMYVGIGF